MDSEKLGNQNLAETVAQLQNQVRWMKGIGIAAALVVVVFVLAYHHQRYRSVTAQEFVLTDAQGTARAKLALFPEGAGLELYAASGEERVQLVGGAEDAGLNLYLPVTATNTSAAVNFYQNNLLTATLGANSSNAVLALHPAADKSSAILALERGRASLTLAGPEDGSPKASLGIEAGNSCVVLDAAATRATPGAKGALCLRSPGLPALELTNLAGRNLPLSPP